MTRGTEVSNRLSVLRQQLTGGGPGEDDTVDVGLAEAIRHPFQCQTDIHLS